jgi:hypothetical protein
MGGIPHPLQGDQNYELNRYVELFTVKLREALSSTVFLHTLQIGKTILIPV